MSIDVANLSTEELLHYLSDSSYYTEAKVGQLEPVLHQLFALIETGEFNDKEMISKFLQISDTLAINYGLPSAVDHFNWHKDESNWKGFDGGELKFDMKGWHKNLQDKVIEDVTGMANSDKVKDEKDGKVVGIKVSDPKAKSNLEIALAHLASPKVEEAAKSGGILKVPKELLTDVGWPAWQDTWDSFQKSVLAQKSPEEMGKAFCEGMFLMPFDMLARTMNKLDAWIIKKGKAAKAARLAKKNPPKSGPEAGNPGLGGPGSGGPGSGGPGSGNPSDGDDISFEEVAAERLQALHLALYKTELQRVLAVESKDDPLAAKLLRAMEESEKTHNPPKDYPDFAKDLNDHIPYLLADPKNSKLRGLALDGPALPDDIKKDYRQKAANIADGLTPEGKSVINKSAFKLPEVKDSDTITKKQEPVESEKYGKGTKTTYNTPSGALSEETYIGKDGSKTIVTNSGQIHLEQQFDKDGKVLSQSLSRGANERFTLKEPNVMGFTYHGHECVARKVPATLYQARANDINALIQQVTDCKQTLQSKAVSHPLTAGRFETVAKEAQLRIYQILQSGGRTDDNAYAHIHPHTSKADDDKHGIIIDKATQSLTRFSEHDGKVDSVSFFPKHKKVIKIDHYKDKSGKEKARVMIYDFSKTPPTSNGRPIKKDGPTAKRWEGFLNQETKLYDSFEKQGLSNFKSILQHLDEGSLDAAWKALNSSKGKGHTPPPRSSGGRP